MLDLYTNKVYAMEDSQFFRPWIWTLDPMSGIEVVEVGVGMNIVGECTCIYIHTNRSLGVFHWPRQFRFDERCHPHGHLVPTVLFLIDFGQSIGTVKVVSSMRPPGGIYVFLACLTIGFPASQVLAARTAVLVCVLFRLIFI